MPEIGDSRPDPGGHTFFQPRECYKADGRPKVAYKNKKAAKSARRLAVKHYGGSVDDKDVYRCPHCKQYHIGSKSG